MPCPLRLTVGVHVHGHDHAEVHVDDLGRQVEISLEVGGVHHVDDHVGNIVDQILADVQLLRAVGREGVGARQVDEDKMVALVFEPPFLGIDGHSAVVGGSRRQC